MKRIIEYESDNMLPEEINGKFNDMVERVFSVKNEEDKMLIYLEHFKLYLIHWFSDHAEKG